MSQPDGRGECLARDDQAEALIFEALIQAGYGKTSAELQVTPITLLAFQAGYKAGFDDGLEAG